MKIELPDDWGNDSITKFMDDAFMNCVATMVNFKGLPITGTMIEVNDLFFAANGIKCHPTKEILLPLFLGRSHSAYLGAVRLSTSGQVAETYMVVRGCLENALYALFIQDDPTKNEPIPNRPRIWLERADNEAAGKRCRNTFSAKDVLENLTKHNKELGRKARVLYQIAIDRGAHPNFVGHLTTSKISLQGGSIDFLIPGDQMVCKACIQFTLQVGLCALKIFELAYDDKFRCEGITPQLEKNRWLLKKL